MNKWLSAILLLLFGCTTNEKGEIQINLFTLEDDIQLGKDLRDEIAADPENYPILDSTEYYEAYAHIYEIRDTILAAGTCSDDQYSNQVDCEDTENNWTGEIEHVDDFDWELYIIDDDEVLNAFCAPGGYIYVYTGLMKFLEYEDELAGVLAHEIAHADLRHSTEQLTKAYGISVLLDILFDGDPTLLSEIAAGLASLSFSREDEVEADSASVDYLCNTDYAADGAAGFFEKLESIELPDFLSTHPNSDTRVDDISTYAIEKECSVEYNSLSEYLTLLDSLPSE